MNYELFIAKRIITNKQGKSSISAPIIKIAITAVALGMVIMMIATVTSFGLQKKIREKLSGFNGHIQITNFDNNNSNLTLQPIINTKAIYDSLNKFTWIKNIQEYATKSALIRTETDFEGVVLKGVSANYNWSFFTEYLTEGRLPNFSEKTSNEVLISKEISNKLQLPLNAKFNLLFLRENTTKPPLIRVVKVVGIYNSGFYEFDKSFIIGDIKHIQRLNKWKANEVGGLEVLFYNFKDIQDRTNLVYNNTPPTLNSTSIIDKYFGIFEWINLFDSNVYLIIGVIILVAGINMITAILVLILERTQMIGILKSLGSSNKSIRKVFLYNAIYLIAKGLFWGNLIGLSLLLLQKHFQIIKLNPENYYVNTVPVSIHIPTILALNAGTLLLCLLMLLLPTFIISKISPVKTIKFQ